MIKQYVPWWSKILVKIVLARVPITYRAFARLGIFRHGRMDTTDYALNVFRSHFRRSEFAGKQEKFVALELGPGDSVGSALIAQAHGAKRCYLVDAGAFAQTDVDTYRAYAQRLQALGVTCVGLEDCCNFEELLQQTSGVYLVDGLTSLRSIPDASVDFVWSQAVLEHIRVAEFDATAAELKRILAPNGVASHRIDLRDHLGGGLHNMRIPSRWWERQWMAESGFYTNRLRYSQMMDTFHAAGFACEVVNVDRWPTPPLPRQKLAQEFLHLSEDDLCISGFNVLLKHPA